MDITPIAERALEFLRRNADTPSIEAITNIGEIFEVEWAERGKKAGSLYITDDMKIVGFKRF